MHVEGLAWCLAHQWSNTDGDDADGGGSVNMMTMIMAMVAVSVAMMTIVTVMSMMMTVIPETPQHTRSLPSCLSILETTLQRF